MADVVQTALAFPPDGKKKLGPKEFDALITSHIKELTKIPTAAWTKQYDKKSLFELLDPAVHSVSYLFTLWRYIQAAQTDTGRLEQIYAYALRFLAVFDPVQVRYAAEPWRVVIDKVALTCTHVERSSPVPNVAPIVDGYLRLDPTAGTFTTTHLHILEACLILHVPSQALPILDKNIYAFPQKPNKNIPEELLSEEHDMSNIYIANNQGFSKDFRSDIVLQYYLIGAQIYTGLRNFSRARLFYEYVLLTPANQHTTSAIQAEAYKKWLLVGLLADGKPWPVPRTLDQMVLRNIRAVSKAYDSIAESFEKRDVKKFQAELDVVGPSEWQESGNFRLIHEVVKALDRYRVIDLQRTYAALPLSRVATLLDLQPQQTLQLLQDTIRDGYLNASVSGTDQDAVLRFHPSLSLSQNSEHDLEAQTARIQELVTYIRDADRRLQLTKEYSEYQKRAKRAGGLEGDPADAMDLSWDAPIPISSLQGTDDEEDIMS